MEKINTIKEIQSISLNILKYIDTICKQHNIQYFLAGGTLLGAIRHKGFIPWDDDVDILMTRDEYEKFLKIMDNQPSTLQYKCLHSGDTFPNYYYQFAKVVDLTTYLDEGNFIRNKDLGVFVDVFPVDGINKKNSKKLIRKTEYYKRMILRAASTKIHNDKEKSILKKLLKPFVYCYAKIFGWKYWLDKHNKLVKKQQLSKSDYAVIYAGGLKEREIFDKTLFNETEYVKFEQYTFPVFKNYDKYLKGLYGDYMTPPPKHLQQPIHTLNVYKK